MTEYENEPVPGLPGMLPPGEQILWQGSPEWRALARTAFHTRLIAAYFAVLAGWALVRALTKGLRAPSDLTGIATTIIVGIIGVGLLYGLAWASARTTIYTLTNRRIVLRFGIALPKCINLPLGLVGAVDLAAQTDGSGDISLTITGEQRLGYVALWPHARPWKIATPQPMLRCVGSAKDIAVQIASTCQAASSSGQVNAVQARSSFQPVLDVAVAA